MMAETPARPCVFWNPGFLTFLPGSDSPESCRSFILTDLSSG